MASLGEIHSHYHLLSMETDCVLRKCTFFCRFVWYKPLCNSKRRYDDNLEPRAGKGNTRLWKERRSVIISKNVPKSEGDSERHSIAVYDRR